MKKQGYLLVWADTQKFVVFNRPDVSLHVRWRNSACSPELLNAVERAIELASKFAIRNGSQPGFFIFGPATDFECLERTLFQRGPPSLHTLNRAPQLCRDRCVGSSAEQF